MKLVICQLTFSPLVHIITAPVPHTVFLLVQNPQRKNTKVLTFFFLTKKKKRSV